MKNKNILKVYSFFYYFLVVIFFVFIIKYLVDFYNKNKTFENKVKAIELKKEIIKPELQFNNTGFQFIRAEKGVENDKTYTLYNIETYGYLGEASAGLLEIVDNQNIFIFKEKPKFKIYINEVNN